jgi:hypothetical protein
LVFNNFFLFFIAIDYIHELEKEKDKHEQELDSLKKEIIALKIMKSLVLLIFFSLNEH